MSTDTINVGTALTLSLDDGLGINSVLGAGPHGEYKFYDAVSNTDAEVSASSSWTITSRHDGTVDVDNVASLLPLVIGSSGQSSEKITIVASGATTVLDLIPVT